MSSPAPASEPAPSVPPSTETSGSGSDATPAGNSADKLLFLRVVGMPKKFGFNKFRKAANDKNIKARFSMQKPLSAKKNRHYRSEFCIIAENEKDRDEAVDFLCEWCKENRELLQSKMKPAKKQSAAETKSSENTPDSDANAESKAESKTEESKVESKTEEPKTESQTEESTEVSKDEEPKTEEPKTEEPKTEESKTEESKTEEAEPSSAKDLQLRFIDETEARWAAFQRRRAAAAKRNTKASTESPAPDGEAKADAGNAPSKKPAARKNNKNNKKSKNASRSADESQSPESQNGPESSVSPSPEGSSSDSAHPAQARNKTVQRRRQARSKLVPQPGQVALRMPDEATVEELRALLPDFSSVEISLKHLPARTLFKNYQKVKLPQYTLALINVGEENQQKVIDILKQKQLHGTPLEPRPGRSRVFIEAEENEARQEESTDELPQVEHVESKD